MDFGLREQDLYEIIALFQRFPAIDEAIIFGSRAKGNYKKGSDVDIAIKGAGITHDLVAEISFCLNEDSDMPYFFDLVHFDEITERDLSEHINRVGQCIYMQEKNDCVF